MLPSHQIDRIATLLASGLKPQQVSSIVGVSPSRVSQIAASPDFAAILTLKQAEVNKKNIETEAISAKYLTAEHILVDQIINLASSAELRDATMALKAVAERQDRAAARANPVHAAQVTVQHIVQLNLPTHALPEITLSANNEVMSIDDKSMAPLTSDGVQNLFSRMKENKNDSGRILEGSSRPVAQAYEEA